MSDKDSKAKGCGHVCEVCEELFEASPGELVCSPICKMVQTEPTKKLLAELFRRVAVLENHGYCDVDAPTND